MNKQQELLFKIKQELYDLEQNYLDCGGNVAKEEAREALLKSIRQHLDELDSIFS